VLNLLDITSEFRTVVMFAIVDLQTIFHKFCRSINNLSSYKIRAPMIRNILLSYWKLYQMFARPPHCFIF